MDEAGAAILGHEPTHWKEPVFTDVAELPNTQLWTALLLDLGLRQPMNL